MQFNIFDTTNVKSGVRTSRPFIRITRKSGTITFNKSASKHFSLTAGMQVRFLQSQSDPQDWFIQFVKKDGFVIREAHDKEVFMFNSSAMVAEIMQSVECFDKGMTLGIGETVNYGKIEATALITLKNK